MKPLTGQRRIAIANGEADISPAKRKAFIDRWKAEGYDLPTSPSLPVVQASIVRRRSNVGTRLKHIISREEPGIMTCGTCKRMVEELNGMTADAVWNDIDRVVANIAERAPQQAPKLWQRIAVRVDQALDLGLTEKKIRGWVTESITGPSRVGGGGLFVPVKGGTRFVKASKCCQQRRP